MLKRDIKRLDTLNELVKDLALLVTTSINADQTNEVKEELDFKIRDTYRKIDKTAIQLIMKGQPLATDLRATLKAIRKADEYRQAYRLSRKLRTKETVKNVRKVLLRSVT